MILSGTIRPGDSATIVGQVLKSTTGALVVQADLSSVTYGITKADGTVVVAAGSTLVIANVIFDTAFLGQHIWGLDSTGGNFRWTIAADVLDDASTEYRAEVVFTETGGSRTSEVWTIFTEAE